MQHYSSDITDQWLLTQAIRFFRNLMRNWEADIRDNDVFDLLQQDANEDMQKAKALFLKHFTQEELVKVGRVRTLKGGFPTREDEIIDARAFFEGDDDAKEACAGEDEEANGEEGAEAFDFDLSGETADILENFWNKDKAMRVRVRALLCDWCDTLERKARAHAGNSPTEARFGEICRTLGLEGVDRELLLYALVRELTCFDDFPIIRTGRADRLRLNAMALDCPCSAVAKAISKTSRLFRYRILDSDFDLRGSTLRDYIESGEGNLLEGEYYRALPLDDTLPWVYYGKLAEEHGPLLRNLLAAPPAGAKGLNILLYGAPGSGKTSFAKTLAKELGRTLIEIRQSDSDGDGNSMENRMTGLRICNDRLADAGKRIILVDEADKLLRTDLNFLSSLFGGGSDDNAEKGAINALLDETKIPTIWIMNAPIGALDDSVRRRFDYSIRFEALGTRQRVAIWRNTLARLNLETLVPADLVERLAAQYPTSAGGIAITLENLKRLNPGTEKAPELIERLITAHCKLMQIPLQNARLLPAKDYTLEGLNIKGEIPLERIVQATRAFRDAAHAKADPDRPRMNLLLWGPPGSGKTEFVKYLGQTLDAKVLVRMGGDLLSKWVGGTEQNIKAAFEEAEADNAILFLDEIDGLVQERNGSTFSWEVTQVNELLQRMENFKGIMIGATNFMAHLDAAILRRFTFKLQFDCLDDGGKRHFFERMFRTNLTPAEEKRLNAIPGLTPGDFRTVRQALYYLGGTPANAELLGELEKECALKRNVHAPIGF